MGKAERHQVIAPVLNKVRQFLLRPELRTMLGQAEPKFQLADIFNRRRIVLVPLNKGIVGAESAKLLGSLVIGEVWTLALSRAGIPPEKRRTVSVFIDEVQDYLRLPSDLSDALAQARGLGVGMTLAHQYREQLPPNLRSGVDANARNKIVFGLTGSDAKDMAAMAPELKPEDFMSLPRYGVYARLQQDGKSTGWVSGFTAKPEPAIRPAYEVKALSMEHYGMDGKEVERQYLTVLGFGNMNGGGNSHNSDHGNNADEPVGRKKRPKTEGDR
jgi:hypothetical protein